MRSVRRLQRSGASVPACVASIVLSLAMAVHAKCTSRDAWSGSDKTGHALIGAVAGLAGTLGTGDPWQGFLLGAGLGVGKELVDALGGGTCSAQDMAVTVIGAALGAGTGWLLLPMHGGAMVVYSTRF